jgi:hypothetical protein
MVGGRCDGFLVVGWLEGTATLMLGGASALLNICRACSRCHASVAQSKQSVFPVPVGDSNRAFSDRSKASRTLPM